MPADVDDAHGVRWLADAGLSEPVYASLVASIDAIWRDVFDPRLIELIRLRVAQLLGCTDEVGWRSPAATGCVDDETVHLLPRWHSVDSFSARERAALAWAEQWIIDVNGIADEDAAGMLELFGDEELARLTLALAMYEALIRTRAALDAAHSEAEVA